MQDRFEQVVSKIICCTEQRERTLQAKKLVKEIGKNQVSNVGSKVIRELANLIGDSNVAVSLSMLHSLKLLMEQGMIQGNLGKATAAILVEKLGSANMAIQETARDILELWLSGSDAVSVLPHLVLAPAHANARLRSQAVSLIMKCVLDDHSLVSACDKPSLVSSLSKAAQNSSSRPAALDTLCRLHSLLGPHFKVLLAASASPAVVQDVEERLETSFKSALPSKGLRIAMTRPKQASDGQISQRAGLNAALDSGAGRLSASPNASSPSCVYALAREPSPPLHAEAAIGAKAVVKSASSHASSSSGSSWSDSDTHRKQASRICSQQSVRSDKPCIRLLSPLVKNTSSQGLDLSLLQLAELDLASAVLDAGHCNQLRPCEALDVGISERVGDGSTSANEMRGSMLASDNVERTDRARSARQCFPASPMSPQSRSKLQLLKQRRIGSPSFKSSPVEASQQAIGMIGRFNEASNGCESDLRPQSAPEPTKQLRKSLSESSLPAQLPSKEQRLSREESPELPRSPSELKTQTQPFSHPAKAIEEALKALGLANASGRKDLDWQAQNQAILDLRRAAEWHSKDLAPFALQISRLLAPSILALRSQTSHITMLLVQDLASRLGRGMDSSIAAIFPPLAQRSGEVSAAGRDTFLASVADSTIDKLLQNVTPQKAVSAMLFTSGHKSARIRAKMAEHMEIFLRSTGPGYLAGDEELLKQIFLAGVNFTAEGSQEARSAGRSIIRDCLQLAGGTQQALLMLLKELSGKSDRARVCEILGKTAVMRVS